MLLKGMELVKEMFIKPHLKEKENKRKLGISRVM